MLTSFWKILFGFRIIEIALTASKPTACIFGEIFCIGVWSFLKRYLKYHIYKHKDTLHKVHICIGIPWCQPWRNREKKLEEDLNPYSKWAHSDIFVRMLVRIMLPSRRPLYMENKINMALNSGNIILPRIVIWCTWDLILALFYLITVISWLTVANSSEVQ